MNDRFVSEKVSPIITPDVAKSSRNIESKRNIPPAFEGSEATAMMEKQKRRGLPTVVIHTDIDNSFKMAKSLEKREEMEASRRLACAAYAADVPIHAITGADFNGVFKRIQAGELPWFQVISTEVGTKRYVLHIDKDGNKTYRMDDTLADKLQSMGFDRRDLAQECAGSPESVGIFRELNEQFEGLDLNFQHPAREQEFVQDLAAPNPEPYKLSGYFFANDVDRPQIVLAMQEKFPGKKVIVCEEIGYNSTLEAGKGKKKYCVDVTPWDKGDEANEVDGALGDPDVSLATGDSGNDIKMLKEGEVDLAVIAGGGKPELLKAMEAEFAGASGLSFRAKGVEDERKVLYHEKTNRTRRGPQTTLHVLEVILRAAGIHYDAVMHHYNLDRNVDYREKRSFIDFALNVVRGREPIPPELLSQTYSL